MPTLDPRSLLYSTGKVPLFARLATLPFLALWSCLALEFAAELAGTTLPWWKAGTHAEPRPHWLAVVCLAIMLAFVALFASVWFLENRVYLDLEERALRFVHRGLFGTSQARLPLARVVSVELRPGSIRANSFWDVSLVLLAGKRRFVTRLYGHTREEALAIAEGIARPMERPLTFA